MKKLLVLLLVFVIAVFAFGRKTKVEFWTLSLSPTFDSYINDIVDSYEEENPNIDIVWVDVPWGAGTQKLTAAIAANKAPDAVNLNTGWVLDLVSKGALQPIDPYVNKVENFRYWSKLWNATVVDGSSYAVPWYTSPQVLIYNRDLFEKAGLDPENPPKTFDEILVAARQIKEKLGVYGVCLDVQGFKDLICEGIDIVNEDKTKAIFNTPEAVEKLKFYQALYNENLMPRDLGGYESAKQKFCAGQLAMYPVGISMLNAVKENSPSIFKNTDVSKYPLGNAKIVDVHPMNFAVPINAKYPQEATKFILWMTSGYWQSQFAKYATVLPSSKISLDSDDWFIEKAQEDLLVKGELVGAAEMEYGAVYEAIHIVPVEAYATISRTINDYWEAAVKGEMTAEKALERAQHECNKVLAGR